VSGPDLVVVNPSGRAAVYQALGASLAAIEPPVWAGLLATFVRGRGFSAAIVDAEAEGLDAAATAERAVTVRPRLIAVVAYGHQPSASTQNMPAAGAVCAEIKRRAPDQPVILVGGHVAALPERTLTEEAADFVCDGEGPHTVADLLEALASGGDLAKVRGLWYRDGDVVRSTPAAPLVADLDREMPGPAWDLLPMHRYRAHNWHALGQGDRQPYAALYTTLGCPYHCSFCCIQAPFKSGERLLGLRSGVNSYRFWSASAVVAQLDRLVEDYGVRHVKIADEMFVLNARHVLSLCDAIIERGHDLNIWAYARIDTVKPAMLDRLRRAGVTWLAFGIEAASERVRGDVDKGFDQDLVFNTVAAVREAGINVIANFIFGLPEDDLASMEATLGLALALNCEFANFYTAMAYPGSPLYATAQGLGWSLPERWSGYSQHAVDTLPLPTKYCSAAEVLRFRDDAFTTYFTGRRYLDLVTKKFGPAAADEIRAMTGHRLERRHA
jgi:anaerobic magnesium-protoporphyrin IX monomethyl ester cyclase